jgi:hypothetical protein
MPTVRQSEDVMRRRGGAGRVALAAVAVVLGLAACKDSGLPDRNLPIEEARQRQYGYPAYTPAADPAPVAAAGRNWVRSAALESIPAHLLVPVSGAEGTQLYAVRGTRAPYSRLYGPAEGGMWAPYLRID